MAEDKPFLDKIENQSEFNSAIKKALDNQMHNFNASGTDWYYKVLKAVDFVANNTPDLKTENQYVSALKGVAKSVDDNTDAQNENTDSNNQNTDAQGEDSIIRVISDKYEVGTLQSFMESFTGLAVEITEVGEAAVNVAGRLEKDVKRIAGVHQEFYASVKQSFGGVNELGSRSANQLSATMLQSYDEFAKRASMTSADLADMGREYLTISGAGVGEFVEGVEDDLSILQLRYENQEDIFRVFIDTISDTAFTYGETISSSLGEYAEDLDLITGGLDISQAELQKIITRTIDRTGEVSIENLRNFNKFAQSAARASGKSAKLIASNMASIIGDVRNFGNVTDEEASRIGTALLEIGVKAETLGSLVGKFSSFDQAAAAVGNLTAAFGLNLDSMEMMMLANEDQEQFLLRMRSAFEEQGLEFREMNLAQQKLLADQLSISVEEAGRLFDFDKDITSIEDLKEAAGETDALEDMQTMVSEIATMVDKGKDLQEIIENNNSFALGSQFVSDIVEANNKIGLIRAAIGELQTAVQAKISLGVKDALDEASETTDNIVAKLEVFEKKSQQSAADEATINFNETQKSDIRETFRSSADTFIERVKERMNEVKFDNAVRQNDRENVAGLQNTSNLAGD